MPWEGDTLKGLIWSSDLQLFLICQFPVCEHHPQLAAKEKAEPLKGLTAERGFWKSPLWERHLHWLARILGSVVILIALAHEFMKESILWNCMFLLKKKVIFMYFFFCVKRMTTEKNLNLDILLPTLLPSMVAFVSVFIDIACQFAFIGLLRFHYNYLIFPIDWGQGRGLR